MTAPQPPATLDLARALAATRETLTHAGRDYWPIAGAFVLLPQLAMMLFGPAMPETPAAIMAMMKAQPLPMMLSVTLPAIIGLIADLAISKLVIDAGDRRPTTPRVALSAALRAWPLLLLALATLFFAMIALAMLASPFGLNAAVLLLSPVALLLMARLLPLTPLLSVEPRAPLEALQKSWALGRGHGWQLLGVALALRLAILIASALASVLGTGIASLLGASAGRFFEYLLPTATVTLLSVATSVLIAQIYRQLRDAAR